MRETKHCWGRCCGGDATDCQKSWGCMKEDDGHISFSSGPHVVITASHKNGSAKSACGAELTQDRTTDSAGRRPVFQASRTLLAGLQACSFASFTPPPASPRCHRNIRDRHQMSVHCVCCPVACSIAQIASPSHPSAIAADHSLRDSCHLRGPGRWEAVLLTLRTRLGYGLARGFKLYSGRLFDIHSH
jgi:hypothetical protein